jgi:pantetheine-phosphate adenylyltransferase
MPRVIRPRDDGASRHHRTRLPRVRPGDRCRRQPAGAQTEDALHCSGTLRFDTLIVDFAREHGAKAIVKGLRAISDFEYEFEMNQLNRTMAPDIESIFMMSSPQFSFLSSSGVKELAMFGGDLTGLVPDAVAAKLQERLKR